MPKPFQLIDLFSGAGGMAYGFQKAGFVPILAVEKESDFAATYRENIGDHVIQSDISEIVDRGGIAVPADIVIGGPLGSLARIGGNAAATPRIAQ